MRSPGCRGDNSSSNCGRVRVGVRIYGVGPAQLSPLLIGRINFVGRIELAEFRSLLFNANNDDFSPDDRNIAKTPIQIRVWNRLDPRKAWQEPFLRSSHLI